MADAVPPKYEDVPIGEAPCNDSSASSTSAAPAAAPATEASAFAACAPTSAPAGDREAELRAQATSVLLPEFQLRLSNALMQEVQLVVDFDTVLATQGDSKGRVKALSTLLVGTRSVVGQGVALAKKESTTSALEAVVAAIEICTSDPAVRKDIAGKIRRVEFVGVDPTLKQKNLSFQDGGLLQYSAGFANGASGIFSKAEVLDIFEAEFLAQERTLVSRFMASGLPPLVERLHAAIGKPIPVQIDIPGMLATSANPTQRLATARTIITRTKMSAKAAVAAKSTLSSLAHKAQSLANNAQSKPMPPQPDAPDREPVTSPNVLLPVVEAFEECCGQHESVRQAIADAIGMLTFVMTPGSNLVATLNLHQSIEQPVVAPSPAGVPPIKDGVLVYNGCFEAGHQGCFSKAVVMGTLEAHFRCREKGFVHALMEKTVPDANARISSVMGKPVQIEVIWTSIFREGLTTEQRIDVADTLAGKNSQFVIQPIVQAIATVVQKIDEAVPAMEQSAGAGPPDNPVKARVSRIVITGLPGAQAKPGLALTPLAQGTDMSSALTYSCALERGTIGCFDVTDFKATLRKIFGIETPKDEKGLQAVFSKADATVAKVGDQISKKLNKMKFW